MRTQLCGAVLGVLLLAVPAVAGQAQAAGAKIPVFVSHSGDDAVGVALVQSIKEALKRATTVTLTEATDEADIVLAVSTMNPDAEKPGLVTTAGWSLLLMKEATKAYIGGGLRLCDKERLQKASTDLVTYVESLLKARLAEIPSTPEREKLEADWMEAVENAAAKLPEESCGVKVKAAFREQMRSYLQWVTAGSLKPDLQDAIKAALSNLTPDDAFMKKLQEQAAKLSQCQAEVAALKKGPTKKHE